MSIREDRLARELGLMQELRRGSTMIDFVARGNPPDDYVVTFRCLGMIAADRTGSEHVAGIYLHTEYPRRAPEVTVLTPCFHPNIAAPFQMPPFQVWMRELLDKAADEEERRQIALRISADEEVYKSRVCLDTLDRNWSPSITLDAICIELGELIQYKRHNVDDPLNLEAAEWTRANRARLPVDGRNLLDLKALDRICLLDPAPGGREAGALRILGEEGTGVLRPGR